MYHFNKFFLAYGDLNTNRQSMNRKHDYIDINILKSLYLNELYKSATYLFNILKGNTNFQYMYISIIFYIYIILLLLLLSR